MAKQGATKNRGNKKPKGERKRAKGKAPPVFGADADLTTVPLHLEAWRQRQSEEASAVLLGMGRDAAFQVLQAAEAEGDDGLAGFARRLAALPPQVETNLYPLRAASVAERVAEAMEAAPLALDAGPVAVKGGAVGLFDPMQVQEALARGGRPRRDDARVEAGDVTWMGLPTAGPTEVRLRLAPPPAGQATRRLRLKVTSGVVFVGPPEASDGPRLGTVRLDPFHTSLDAHLGGGALVRLKPGVYAVHGFLAEDGGLEVHLVPDPDPKGPLDVSAATLAQVPRAG